MLLGLDVGTTTITGVAWQAATGRVLALARQRNNAALPGARAIRAACW